MVHLYQSAFLEALGWALLDSLWQMGTLWLIYVVFTFNGNKYSAAFRHGVALAANALGIAWFLVTLVLNYNNAVNNESLYSLSYFFKDGLGNMLDNWRYLDAAIPTLSFLYLVTVMLYAGKLVIHLRSNRNIFKESLHDPGENIVNYLQRLCEKLGISRKVRIWISEKVESPLTFGFLKPLILLPVAAINHLTPSQLEAVIAHELFHIRRNDYLLNLMLVISEVLFFFNPFARIMAGTIKREREHSCDDRVLELGINAWEYSQALYLLGKSVPARHPLALAATGSGKKILLCRIKRMLKNDSYSPSIVKPVFTFFLCLALTIFATRRPGVQVLPGAVQASIIQVRETESPLKINAPKAMVYIEEKKVVVTPPKESRAVKKRGKDLQISPDEKTREGLDEIYLPSDEEAIRDLESLNTFIDRKKVIEFSMPVHIRPEPPLPVTGGRPLPYVPRSTFYYPIDNAPAPPRKIISL